MKTHLPLFILMIIGIFSCKEVHKTRAEPSSIDHQKTDPTKESLTAPLLLNPMEDKHIHTNYEYTDSTGRQLTIQNSYPKGGLKYTDSKSREFTYAVFWTQISNKADSPLNVTIEFSGGSLELPNSSSTYFNVFLPTETMTPDKVFLFNYGLENLKSSLDNGFGKPSSIQKTIHSKEAFIFYVVVLSNKGIDGVVRAGFKLKEQQLIYLFNKKEMNCGQIEFSD